MSTTLQAGLTEATRDEIRTRAARAANTNSVVDAVLCALIETDIDQWDVSVDDWRGILAEAFQVARDTRDGLAA